MKVLYKDNEAKEAMVLVEAKPGAIIPEPVHGGAGHSVCEGGLMIDLSRMNSVLVDRSRRVAGAAGGADDWRKVKCIRTHDFVAHLACLFPLRSVALAIKPSRSGASPIFDQKRSRSTSSASII
jgi:hypothetical protein